MSKRYVSAGGLKLEAAIEAFGLHERIRGAMAIDVGAGTGGFTDCLLQYGATHVTAVDVGHGQLAPDLRADSRVLLLEGAHFKKLPLTAVPGPFSFFVVDVSFMAARSVLRPISFRVPPGTEGVVLVKPQFELPKVLVPRGGVVESRNLRKLAFNRFKKGARKRGFRIIEKVDCPVPGGAGNVEILVHLVLDRVPASTANKPAPGHSHTEV